MVNGIASANGVRPSMNGAKATRTPWIMIAGGFHQRGGMDKANAALAEYLLDRGTPVHIVTLDADRCFMNHPDATIHIARKPIGSHMLGEFALDRIGRAAVARVRRDSSAARIVVNGGNCDMPDINWVHAVHHAWMSRAIDAPRWFRAKDAIARSIARRREAIALRHARVIIANSHATRRDLIDHLDLDPHRVHTIYLGADPDAVPATPADRARARAWLRIPDSRPIVAFVGAIGYDARKGFDTLWDAWCSLCRHRPEWDARLIVAGGGLGLPRWRSVVARSPYASRVTFLGHTDRIAQLLAAADLLVSPARYEPYGLNVQEAICRGVPAIVSATAGIAERYPAELRDLLLPDPNDAGALAGLLLRWRTNLAAWKERVLPFARELRTHTWRNMAAEIVTIAEQTP